MESVRILPASRVVGLINGYADAAREEVGEARDPYPPVEILDTFAVRASEAVALANGLHRVFAEPHRATDLLNELADQHGLSHRLATDGRLGWDRPETSNPLAAATVAALIDFVAGHGPDRLGTCNADACVDAYIDASQARTRSYCSDQCHNRTRVARWRARRQVTGRRSL